MQSSIELSVPSNPGWIEVVINDFDSFLQDHADCERKASAMALSFVAKCPEKVEIIPLLIETALEELEHFQSVYQIMQKRGVPLKSEMPKDIYIHHLLALCRSSRDERLMDRMLLASIIECRGAERFALVAKHIEDLDLKKFYKQLWTSEAKHGHIFVDMALKYWPKKAVYQRLNELNHQEGEICNALPLRAALH